MLLNFLVFDGHWKTEQPDNTKHSQMATILLSYVLVWYSNGWSSTIAHSTYNDHLDTEPFEYWTPNCPIFECSVQIPIPSVRFHVIKNIRKINFSGRKKNYFLETFFRIKSCPVVCRILLRLKRNRTN